MAQGSDRRAGRLDVITVGCQAAGNDADPSPEDLRAAIAETRAELARHLGALKHHLFHPHISSPEFAAETDMATAKKKTTRRPSAARAATSKPKPSSAASSSKSKSHARSAVSADEAGSSRKPTASPSKMKAKPASTNPKPKAKAKTRRRPAVHTVLARTGEVLDTVVAGAVVGAITGAAQSVAKEPTAVTGSPGAMDRSPAAAGGPGTKRILGELAPGAAAGAVSGAAKSVLPPENDAARAAKKSPEKKKGTRS
jgi:hypothetical protein